MPGREAIIEGLANRKVRIALSHVHRTKGIKLLPPSGGSHWHLHSPLTEKKVTLAYYSDSKRVVTAKAEEIADFLVEHIMARH